MCGGERNKDRWRQREAESGRERQESEKERIYVYKNFLSVRTRVFLDNVRVRLQGSISNKVLWFQALYFNPLDLTAYLHSLRTFFLPYVEL